jgi:hypothetical protein
VSPEPRFVSIPGRTSLVLVAPHGGRRDPARRPWSSGRLKVNDLHTAELAEELAALTGGAALVNASCDRNDVDLNRVSEAHERGGPFLAALAELLETTLAHHGRATLLTVHGWNAIQPAVDLGLGCAPGADPFAVGPGAAVSSAFAAGALRRLIEACAVQGINATVGARYPARARENLLQLFTARYREDVRAPVRRLAALASRVEAVQLELGIPLRWPGAWRGRFLAAAAAALPALVAPAADARPPGPRPLHRAAPRAASRIEWTTPTLCGLAGLDAGRGARLVLFLPEGGLLLFTGERTGDEEAGRVAGLAVESEGGVTRVRFTGPLLRFPDTTPFLDLEAGLARAALVEADVHLDFHASLATDGGAFGAVEGRAVLDGEPVPLAGYGFSEGEAPGGGPWPRLRAALRLGESRALRVVTSLGGGAATGVFHRAGDTVPVVGARVTLGPAETPLEHLDLEVELADGERLRLTGRAAYRLPVVRMTDSATIRLEFAACRLDEAAWPAGWCEVIGI